MRLLSSRQIPVSLAAPPATVSRVGSTHPLAPRKPHFAAKAKSVIWLFLNGGQSHVDTWDYKPELQKRSGQTINIETRRRKVTPCSTASQGSARDGSVPVSVFLRTSTSRSTSSPPLGLRSPLRKSAVVGHRVDLGGRRITNNKHAYPINPPLHLSVHCVLF